MSRLRIVSWADIEQASLNDPILHALVHEDRRRPGEREDLLIGLVLSLCAARQTDIEREIERMRRTPQAPVWLEPPAEAKR